MCAAAQRVRKRYLAVALGRPQLDAWTEDGPIDLHPTTKCGMQHDYAPARQCVQTNCA